MEPAHKKRIGVVGCGQWGPNQIRAFFFHPGSRVVRICDKDQRRLDANRELYPEVDTTQDYKTITRGSDIDAVIVTTPVSTHYEITKDALLNGKDVLCEKPLTFALSQSRELSQLAQETKRVLMVGHIFLFNSGILKLKEIMDSGELGAVRYFYAQRTNLGPVRRDVNAVYDLASHDISIFNFLMNARPKVLSVEGKCYLQKDIEDVAFISLEYPGGILAHIHVSWLDPKKIRRITVVGEKKMTTWDDMEQSGPVEIYSKNVERTPYYRDYGEFQLLVKEGEVVIPNVRNIEPMKLQTDHFIECLVTRKQPVADAAFGVQVVETLAQIQQKLEEARR